MDHLSCLTKELVVVGRGGLKFNGLDECDGEAEGSGGREDIRAETPRVFIFVLKTGSWTESWS